MIHEDGIEVYLKPVGPDSDNVRFAEFPLEDVQIHGEPDSNRNRRCVILARPEAFQVVVRINDKFKMYGANSLAFSTKGQDMPVRTASRFERIVRRATSVLQRSYVYEQHVRSTHGWEVHSTFMGQTSKTVHRMPLEMKHSAKAIVGTLDRLEPAEIHFDTPQEGTILISVFRSSVKWRDESSSGVTINKRLYGPGDPSVLRTHVKGSCKPLDSKNGKYWFFEFRYRSRGFVSAMRDLLQEQHKGREQQTGIALDLVRDNVFVAKREQDRLRREELSAKYHDNRLPPKFCDCSDPTHKQSKPKSASTPRIKLPTTLDVMDSPLHSKAKSVDEYVTDGDVEDRSNLVEPAAAPICVSCQKFKVPEHRRPAFLRKWLSASAVLSDQTPSKDLSRPTSPDSSDWKEDTDERRSLTGIAQEALGQKDLGGQEAPVEDSPPHEQSDVAQPSDTVLQDSEGSADAEDFGPADALTVKSNNDHGIPIEAPTNAHADETALDKKQSEPADLRAETGEAFGSVPSVQKRTADVLLDQRPVKRQRTSIDLTDDHADGLVTVKEEQIERNETKAIPTRQQAEEDEDLQETLEDIDRELEIKRLEKRRAEVIRKQKQKQKQAALKLANTVKVKKGIIQIEDD
ncbi:hypothetical protein HII31_05704 [Pseudocercospora fuligena]|uniref:Uncharacterized protein n=1 Tax=Pseudocercospora fuligena TaxID=685502 RepID=A0A8H6VHV2_9PEZI|nr:hypothetical protein HII31_05704 [Pseudocercospora fuligena]